MHQIYYDYRDLMNNESLWARPSIELDYQIAKLLYMPLMDPIRPLPYSSDRGEAELLWIKCLHDEKIPDGDALSVCRKLMEEAEPVFGE
jgi:hypothetical protein